MAHGNGQVCENRDAQAAADHPSGLDPVAQTAADQLACAIGHSAAGQGQRGSRLSDALDGDNFRNHGTIVNSGQIAYKVNVRQQHGQASYGLPCRQLFAQERDTSYI